MRYTPLLGRIFRAADNLKLEGIHKQYPEATWNQVCMWINWLRDESDYSKSELEKITLVLTKYLEV